MEVIGRAGRVNKMSMQKSRIKTMLTLFFDSRGITCKLLVIDSETVNTGYHLEVLNQFWARIWLVQPEYQEQGGWFLLCNNAPSQKNLSYAQGFDQERYRRARPPFAFAWFHSGPEPVVPEKKLVMKGRSFDTF